MPFNTLQSLARFYQLCTRKETEGDHGAAVELNASREDHPIQATFKASAWSP